MSFSPQICMSNNQYWKYWKRNFVIKLEKLKRANKWGELKRWLQWGETDSVWESRLATRAASLCPSSSCALDDTVIIVCNGFCQWHMREGWSCPCLFSTWPNITLSPKWWLSKTFSGVHVTIRFFCEILRVCLTTCVSKEAVGRSERYPLGGWRPPFVRVIRPSCYVIPSVMT